MQRNVRSDIVSRPASRLHNLKKVAQSCIDDHIGICRRIVKGLLTDCSKNICLWPALVDAQTFDQGWPNRMCWFLHHAQVRSSGPATSSFHSCCIFGSHTFVPVSWMCKKKTSVPHSSTEAEIISLDASSRMHGSPALDLLHLFVEVFHYTPNQSNKAKDSFAQGECGRVTSSKRTKNQTEAPTTHDSSHVDNVLSSVSFAQSIALFVCVWGQWSRD